MAVYVLSSNDLSAAIVFLSREEAVMKYSAKDSKAVRVTQSCETSLHTLDGTVLLAAKNSWDYPLDSLDFTSSLHRMICKI